MLYFVTGNKNKFREYQKILGPSFNLKRVNLDLEEIQSIEPSLIVKNKAKLAFSKIKKPVLVEDGGVFIDDFNGFPGALIKWMVNSISLKKICRIIGKNRKAKIKISIGYFNGRIYKEYQAEMSGQIAESPRGQKGWEWDKIFIPTGYNKTMAELGPEIKNKIFVRKIALEKLKKINKIGGR